MMFTDVDAGATSARQRFGSLLCATDGWSSAPVCSQCSIGFNHSVEYVWYIVSIYSGIFNLFPTKMRHYKLATWLKHKVTLPHGFPKMKAWPTVKDLIHHHLGEQRGWRTVFHIPEWPWKYVLILFPPSKPSFCILFFSCSCLVLRVMNIRPCMQFIANTHFYHTLVWLVKYDPCSLITADQLLTNGQLLYHVVLFSMPKGVLKIMPSIYPSLLLSIYSYIYIYIDR